jgi:hypothetical protein
MELGLNATGLLELTEESTFVRRDRGKSVVEGIKDRGLWKGDGNIFKELQLLGYLRLLLLVNG